MGAYICICLHYLADLGTLHTPCEVREYHTGTSSGYFMASGLCPEILQYRTVVSMATSNQDYRITAFSFPVTL